MNFYLGDFKKKIIPILYTNNQIYDLKSCCLYLYVLKLNYSVFLY